MTRTVALVPHTHWDREWYSSFQTFRARLVGALSATLDLLERDPSVRHFHLDGQLAAVEDYLELRPEDEGRIRALVAAGRIAIGPWYALMDEFLVSGETIVRNLQAGMAGAARLGGHQPVGYLPDMFGHIAQMPQLLRLAGLRHAVVWRGVPSAVDRSAFWWRSPDGSTVRAEYLPAGYSNGASLPADPDALIRRLRAHERALGPFIGDGSLLLMGGTDHEAPAPWLGDVVEKVNATSEDYRLEIVGLADYLRAAPSECLPSWTGELRSSARANLLMGTLSTRVDVKRAAAIAERTLERLAEPLAALWLPPAGWPGTLFDTAWREMIRNSAHDSVCGCSADEVNTAVLHRYADATAIGAEVVADVHRHVAARMAAAGPVVVNPAPRPRRGLVELVLPGDAAPAGMQLVDRLDAGTTVREGRGADLARLLAELTEAGWLEDGRATSAEVDHDGRVLEVRLVWDRSASADGSLRPIGPAMAEVAAMAAAHAHEPLRVTVERPATVRVLARTEVPGYGWAAPRPVVPATPVRGGDNWLDNGQVHLAVNPADGTFSLNGLAGLDRLVDEGDAGDTYNWSPPEEDLVVERPDAVEIVPLEDGPLRGRLLVRRTFTWPARLEGGRRVGAEVAEVRTLLELHAGERLVRVSAELDNPSRDHRLRTVFPLPRRADHSVAECAFATVTRGLAAESGPGEVGLATFPSRRWVSAGGLTVTHEGLTEYEVVDEGWALALTLLRSTGLISRPAPAWRPNAAGPPLPTPANQLVGPLAHRYAVAVGAPDPWALAEDAWLPLQVVHAAGGGDLPARGAHLEVSGAQVSALRRTGGHLELRVFNPCGEGASVSIPGRSGWLVDLTGRLLERWEGTFPLPAWGIGTVLLDAGGAGRLPS